MYECGPNDYIMGSCGRLVLLLDVEGVPLGV